MTLPEGAVALVTGSTRGIGRAIASRLIAAGATVAVNGRDPVAVERAAEELGAVPLPFDVSSSGAVDSAVARLASDHGRLDIVVNNAGIALDNFITAVTDERWEQTLAVNLSGAFWVLRAAARAMKTRGTGTILNVSSWAGVAGNVGQVAYSASKGGIQAMTLTAAKELGRFGIRVNAMAPLVETEMTDGMTEEMRAALLARQVIKRSATVDEIAEAAYYLVSDASSFTTGQLLWADGGYHLG